MTTYNNVLDVFSYAAHTLANTLWSERALTLSSFIPTHYHTFFYLVSFSSFIFLTNKECAHTTIESYRDKSVYKPVLGNSSSLSLRYVFISTIFHFSCFPSRVFRLKAFVLMVPFPGNCFTFTFYCNKVHACSKLVHPDVVQQLYFTATVIVV